MPRTAAHDSAPRPAAPRADGADYVVDEQVGYLMRVAVQRHTVIFSALMPHDLTPPQFAALAKLREIGACSQNSLGRLIALDAATIKGVAGRLERRGLVAIAPDPNDRRRRTVSLTDAGRAAADEAMSVGRRITEETLEPLTRRERETLCALLRKIA